MPAVIENLHLNYIKQHLLGEIVAQLENETLVSYTTDHAGGLDGFMSAIYNIELQTQAADDSLKQRLFIVKLMKGDNAFRVSSKSYIQFANEVYVYDKVLPTYKQLLTAAGINDVCVEDWVPRSYKAQFGYIPGLSDTSDSRESILVLEHLKPQGYTLGPRLELTRDQLLSMCKPLAEYHALCYALRLVDAAQLQQLQQGITPLYFYNEHDAEDAKTNIFRVLHGVGFERFYDFFDRKIAQAGGDSKLMARLHALREKYAAEPARLLERLRVGVNDTPEDQLFGAILHGDFNRNNVLFRFKAAAEQQQELVEDVKMIDFQELRYGSPALDLSFFMYMNMPESQRSLWWSDILQEYHRHMHATLSHVLRAYNATVQHLATLEEFLANYSYDKFYAHFSRYAFYGVIICMHFLPWILCSEQECALISRLFEEDMHSAQFHRVSIDIGGDGVNERIFNIIKHACNMGYMDNI